jgi:hypothetical protein
MGGWVLLGTAVITAVTLIGITQSLRSINKTWPEFLGFCRRILADVWREAWRRP